jgi:ribose transport system substrate-binding protein
MNAKNINRREFLKLAGMTVAAGSMGGLLAGCVPAGAPAAPQVIKETVVVEKAVEKAVTPVYMANVIRTLSNEYHQAWNRGGRLYAEAQGQGKGYRTLLCEGDSEKQLTMMKALIQEGGKDVIFNIDPNQSPDAKPIADMCKAAGVYFVTQWNKPDDLHPWDYDPYWVCHMGVDGVPSGYYIAQELFKAMGGKGKIVALQGLLANVPAVQRFDGLKKALAENPNIELLADQTASWSRTEAVTVTEAFLAKYPDIGGIWAANDNMGLGALEALRAAKKNKTIPVAGIDGTSEAIQAVVDGEFAATVMNDPMWQGGMGLSLAYQAKNGVFDPSKEPHEHREFYFTPVFVGADNAKEVQQNYVFGIPTYAWDDLWGRVQKS